jgi:hypothetical protein
VKKYRVLVKADDSSEATPVGSFDTLLEANTWIQNEGHRDEHDLGTYDVEVVDE